MVGVVAVGVRGCDGGGDGGGVGADGFLVAGVGYRGGYPAWPRPAAAIVTRPAGDVRDERCGTYAGVQQHRRRREPACDKCREAAREYTRNVRARTGPAKDKWWNGTRGAALELLAAEYPERFSELLAEKRKSGPTPWDPGDAP